MKIEGCDKFTVIQVNSVLTASKKGECWVSKYNCPFLKLFSFNRKFKIHIISHWKLAKTCYFSGMQTQIITFGKLSYQ